MKVTPDAVTVGPPIFGAPLIPQKGKGAKHFEVPMFDVQLSMLGYISTMYLNNGDIPQPPGSAHEYMVPYQAFPTATIYIVLSPREERFYKKMCEV